MRPMKFGSNDTLTVDKLLLQTASLRDVKVVVSHMIQPVLILQLSPTFKWCSDEFREKMNSSLLKRFGTKEVCYMMGDTIVISPRHEEALRLL